MRQSWLTRRDTAAGAVLMLLGGLALYLARDFAVGTATAMGPGYFPNVLAVILVLLGLVIVVKAAFSGSEGLGEWHMRPLLAVSASVLLFSLGIDSLGLVAATAALVLVARLAAPPYRPVEVLVLALGLCGLCVVLFIDLLALPLRAW